MRSQSLDLARSFTVLFIAPIHVVLLFASPTVYNTWPVDFLRFIAKGPSAQLFMLLMGISFVLGRPKSPQQLLSRVGVLLLAGYLLNFLKFVLPGVLGLLPAGIYQKLQVERGVSDYVQMLLSGDILHVAALAYVLIYLVSRLRRYPHWAAFVAILVCFLSPLCYDLHSGNRVLNYVLQLLGGQPPQVFFPLLPWLVYPLAGLVIGHNIKKGNEMVFGYAAVLGLILLLFSCRDWMPFHNYAETSFYRTYPNGTFYHLGLVLIWLYRRHMVATRHPNRIQTKFVSFLSSRITLIYIVHWLVICWSLPLVGFRTLGFKGSMLAATGLGAFAIIISCLYLVIKKS